MTITEFLLARIAEDGRDLDCGRHDHDASRSAAYLDCRERPLLDCDFRQKREWLAKRRIIELHSPTTDNAYSAPVCTACLTDRVGWSDDWGPDKFPCDTLRTLASVYADRPDYDDAWRVD